MFGDFYATITRNLISASGTVITLVAGIIIAALIALEFAGLHFGPYIGILTFLVLPALLVLGLLLIPIGLLRARRRGRREGDELPILDFNNPRTRNVMLAATAIGAVNVVILAAATYKGVEVMDSTEFCGTACHSVMHPEFTAYQRSPHARVDCVDCHIGPGADWFVKSKISGSWQLIAVMLDLYPRPIPTPVHDLRPARETCEQCHWPEQFVGETLRVKTHYDDDEANTELKTVLLLKVGGHDGGISQGIHWHVDPANEVRYLSDPDRETIYDVELRQPDGTVKVFRSGEAPEDAQWRTMDCVDCHNRPTHVYRRPEDEVDAAIEKAHIDRALPYVRREAVAALRADYASHDAARSGIAETITAFYASEYPEVSATKADAIEQAAATLGQIYALNVFPAMKVSWDTYPDHIGHEASPGCFRCHDKRHRAEDRQRISKDCDTCHVVLAEAEEDPPILRTLRDE